MTSVVFYNETDTGVPQLSGTAGSLVSVLDACLVNGFNLRSATSIVVNAGVATLTTSLAHGFKDDAVLLVEGASPIQLNGRKRLLSRTTNTVTFDAAGVANGTATGSISVRYAPAGWQIAFSDTNRRVYRSPSTQGTRMFFGFDDTGTIASTHFAAENATDVSTFIDAWVSGRFLIKSASANSTAVPFDLIADDRTVYFRPQAGNNEMIYGFGDYESIPSNNPYAAFSNILHTSNLSANSANNRTPCLGRVAINNGLGQMFSLPRDPTWLIKQVQAYQTSSMIPLPTTGSMGWWLSGVNGVPSNAANSIVNPAVSQIQYPANQSVSLVLQPNSIVFSATTQLAGNVRGTYFCPQSISDFVPHRQIIERLDSLSEKKFICLRVIRQGPLPHTLNSSGFADAGRMFFDISGPWS